MAQIIVISDRPNITSLPYNTGKIKGVFDFLPGKNEIEHEVWSAIAREAGEDMKHYRTFLKPLEISPDESGKIDLAALSAEEFISLIDNTMDTGELSGFYGFESGGKSRKTVLAAIAAQVERLNAIDIKKKGKK